LEFLSSSGLFFDASHYPPIYFLHRLARRRCQLFNHNQPVRYWNESVQCWLTRWARWEKKKGRSVALIT
jgi:hypothetical protein